MLTIKINGVDKSNQIDWGSFELINVLTKEVDTFSFLLRVHSGKTYLPTIGQEIEIFDGATKIYGGYIVEFERKIEGKVKKYSITCKDYHYALDRRLVFRNYSNQSAGSIVIDIINNFTTGFTTNNVKTGPTIEDIQFNYEQVSRAIQQIAERINWDWYVDENKDVHFFSKEDYLAPFELNDTEGNFIWNSIQLNTNINNIKNCVYIRGGMEMLGPKTFKKIADGTQRIFNLGYDFTNLTIKKGGVVQTLGKDGVDEPDTVDILYNPNNQTAIFRDDNKPANGVEVEWSGNASMPVVAQAKNLISISQFGLFEFLIRDKTIISNAEAKQRADAELVKFLVDTNEFVFRTRKDGLKVGQKMRFNSSYWEIDKWFTIKRVITKIINPITSEREYIVTCFGSEIIGIIDILGKLLSTDPNKNIEIFKNEILAKYFTVSDNFKMTDLTPTVKWRTGGPWYVKDANLPVGLAGFCQVIN